MLHKDSNGIETSMIFPVSLVDLNELRPTVLKGDSAYPQKKKNSSKLNVFPLSYSVK